MHYKPQKEKTEQWADLQQQHFLWRILSLKVSDIEHFGKASLISYYRHSIAGLSRMAIE